MENIFDIRGKKIIFTGATGHLGNPIANYLESQGAVIIRASRTEINSDSSFKLDITNDTNREEFVRFIEKKIGYIDGIINNAYSGTQGELFTITREDFENSLEMTLTSPFFLIQRLLPFLKKGSSIVNISSMYGIVSPDPRIYGTSGQNSSLHYGVGKAGLIHMTKYLACHLTKKDIRVNAVSPGPFPNLNPKDIKGDFHKQLENKVPMGRIGKPEDLFGVIHFLLSDSSLYLNGTNIPVDGGWTAW